MRSWEADMVRVLTDELRMVSVEQAARFWWPRQRRSLRTARESVDVLCEAGWLELHSVLSRPVAPLTSALVTWKPGRTRPDSSALSRTLRRRARDAARLTNVITVGHRVGRHGSLKLTQMTHDLHVAEVWWHYRQLGEEHISWISEDRLTSVWSSGALPDAVLQNQEGQLLKAVEYGGDYGVDRLAKLHRQLNRSNLPYEIW